MRGKWHFIEKPSEATGTRQVLSCLFNRTAAKNETKWNTQAPCANGNGNCSLYPSDKLHRFSHERWGLVTLAGRSAGLYMCVVCMCVWGRDVCVRERWGGTGMTARNRWEERENIHFYRSPTQMTWNHHSEIKSDLTDGAKNSFRNYISPPLCVSVSRSVLIQFYSILFIKRQKQYHSLKALYRAQGLNPFRASTMATGARRNSLFI